ncbi:MAG: acyltransferase [Methylocapsa sp.]|nr:acyltransferase [Methylocapsa sp.]
MAHESRGEIVRLRAVNAAYPVPEVKGYVSEVDALRALAMTAVFAYHCDLMPFGWAGVWLFFVISGFAITSSLLGSVRVVQSKVLLLRNFYARRCLRIWPVYILIVTGSMIAAALAGNHEALGHWPWLATFTYNYLPLLHREHWGVTGHLWTISVEEQFYLIFPFLFAFLGQRWLVAALWVCVALSPALRAALIWGLQPMLRSEPPVHSVVHYFGPAHFDAFSAGALLAILRPLIATRLSHARIFLAAALGAAAVYFCIYLGVDAAGQGFNEQVLVSEIGSFATGEGRETVIYTVLVGLASALIALILAGEAWLVAFCRLPLLRPIGRVSYGAYVYHFPLLSLYNVLWPSPEGFVTWTGGLSKFGVGYAVTLLIAFLSFRYIEAPVLRLRARFS